MEISQYLPNSIKITNLVYTYNINNLFTLYDAKVIRLSHTGKSIQQNTIFFMQISPKTYLKEIGKVNLQRTLFPFRFPGIHRGMVFINRIASSSNFSSPDDLTTLISEKEPSFSTIKLRVHRPILLSSGFFWFF